MIHAGDTIENPSSGERITFDTTAAESDGRYLAGRIRLAPHGLGPPEHVHPVIEERFSVLSGRLTASVGGIEHDYGPGNAFIVPPGTAHRWWNRHPQPVEIEFRVSPALPLDRFLESVFALVQMGKADVRGLPGPLRMAPILREHWDVLYLAKPPLPVQKAVMAALSVPARILGYPASYEYRAAAPGA